MKKIQTYKKHIENLSTTYKIKMVTLSPIYIGTSIPIEPFSFVIKEKNGEYIIYHIDTNKFLLSITDEESAFINNKMKASNGMKLIQFIRKYIFDNFDEEKFKDSIKLKYNVSPEIYNDYYESINAEKFHRIELYTFPKDGNFNGFIPGSVIKGMLKNRIIEATGKNDFYYGIKKSFKEDPFKMLSISDAYADSNINYSIGYIKNFKIKKLELENKKVNHMVEVIDAGVEFEIEVTVKRNFASNQMYKQSFYEELFLDRKKVIKLLNKTFNPAYKIDFKNMKIKGGNKFNPFILKSKSSLKNIAPTWPALIWARLTKKYAFANIGRYGGEISKGSIESIKNVKEKRYFTYEEKFKDKNNKEKIMYNGEEVLPLGWILFY